MIAVFWRELSAEVTAFSQNGNSRLADFFSKGNPSNGCNNMSRTRKNICRLRITWSLTIVLIASVGLAQDHSHSHGDSHETTSIAPPQIYLDKSPRIVQYQLNRLDNQRLLLVERKTDHPKYALVYLAILNRAGMSRQHRDEALQGLIQLNKTSERVELLSALNVLDPNDVQQQRTATQLASMLLQLPDKQLAAGKAAFVSATESEIKILRAVGHAALIVSGNQQESWNRATGGPGSTLDWLSAVHLIPQPTLRSALRDSIVSLLDSNYPVAVRRRAISTLARVPSDQQLTFRQLAPFVASAEFRIAAIRTLLKVPDKHRDRTTSTTLVDVLVKYAEATPASDRTSDDFIDAMQLADQLLGKIPVMESRAYRQRLREITVRVVTIHTVEEEMRYDVGHFAIEAGRPVQVVLKNEDLMPHNLVITTPGALQQVAEAGAVLGPSPGFENKPYVPQLPEVLFATGMVQSRQQTRLTFTAPTETGEFPFVCTFPRHWMRMYGVMIVVKDLDAWQQNPTIPKDPLGNNRAFVQSWKPDDFRSDLDAGLQARSLKIGEKIFEAATCAQCHKVNNKGGSVGPELTDVLARLKGDRFSVLREILDPSHHIDPKYAVQVIVLADGRVMTGIVKAEDKTSISLLTNPESPKPDVIQKSDIDEMHKTSKSMMPKALLDRFTKDEIFELLAYLVSQDPDKPAP